MLELTNVQKHYQQRVVLEIPSLQLDKGIYWIKGANGSGKSTLLKMIAGLIPFEGSISYNKTDLRKDALAYRQQIGWAEAEPLYPPFM
jgi:ABC-2 type transport system ATP-binding protein